MNFKRKIAELISNTINLCNYTNPIGWRVLMYHSIGGKAYNDKIGIEDESKTFLIILSILMIFLDLSEDIIRVFTGYYSINKDLPLQLCSIGVYLAAFNLIYRNQTIFNLIFYWGFVGATNAILTPDGDLFELRIFFF